MRLTTRLVGVAVLLLVASSEQQGWQRVAAAQTSAACEVTTPNGIVADGEQREPHSHGNRQLSTFGLGPSGTVVFRPGGPGFVTQDGSLGMKFGWQRGAQGRLSIEGRRLDSPASPLRSEVPSGYGDSGFQATYLIFSTPGCWEVTGHVGSASLTFVTLVTKVGDGPEWHREPS
jgi:hypothetical protein